MSWWRVGAWLWREHPMSCKGLGTRWHLSCLCWPTSVFNQSHNHLQQNPPPNPKTPQEEVAGKEEAALRRLLNENEEVARQRDALKKRLELMERAAAEIMNFRV